MHEIRYSELRAEGEPAAVRRGRQAMATSPCFPSVESVSRFERSATWAQADVILNTMHDRRRPLARSGSGLDAPRHQTGA